jgi:hypothetical protein
MAIATAPVDYEAYDRTPKPTPLDGPALEALKACAELRSASLDALRTLSRQATLRPVGRGATVAAQGTRLDAAILVVRGRIRSVCRAPNGREISVEVFRTGDLVADFALSADAPLANDWEAGESSTLLMIPRDVFMAFLRGAPEVMVAVAAGLCGRLERCARSPGRGAPARGSAHSQPPDAAGAGQPDRRLPRNGVANRLRAGPSGPPDAARAVPARQQAPDRRHRLTARSRAVI